MARLRLAPAAAYLGVHPITLRRWADAGRVEVVWVGRERRFDTEALDAFLGVASETGSRREALYVRVSGSTGQETSLMAQEAELRATASGDVVAVFKDRASGLRENRPGLSRLLKAAAVGEFTVVRVTHEDRLARFGVVWLTGLLNLSGVTVEVLHPKGSAGGMEELLADFTSLVSTFAGRIYGMRSREARRRLLAAAETAPDPAPETPA
jgi:excisionase family DNA binding protein